MMTMAGWNRGKMALLACFNLLVVSGAQAQVGGAATNVPSLTLTGNIPYGATMTVPQVLDELKVKIRLAIAAKDYQSALNNTMAGLRVSPSDFQLLSSKAIILAKLHQYPAAITAIKDALAVEPNNPDAVYGLAELLLITNRIDEYRALATARKAQIDAAYDGVLAKYFAVLEAYQKQDAEKFRAVVTKSLAALPSRTGPYMSGWEFDEVRAVLSQQPESPKKAMLLMFVRVLQGDVGRDEGLMTIRGL